MENYKYMINIMNKVNEEYFKMDTPSVNAEGVQKDYDELLEKHHELAEKYSEIAHENEVLRKEYGELLIKYTELLQEKGGAKWTRIGQTTKTMKLFCKS